MARPRLSSGAACVSAQAAWLTSQYRLGEISGGARAVHIHHGRELFVLTFRVMSTSTIVRLAFETNAALDRVVRDMMRAFPELDVR